MLKTRSSVIKFVLAVALICFIVGFSSCGKQGIPGPRGEPGATGAQGDVGPQGPAGADALPVTVVQLCPGVTTYPATFVEVAFCIGGTLYATYSTHGGFSTELPPGTYSSNAVGSSCTFTVIDGCEVSY